MVLYFQTCVFPKFVIIVLVPQNLFMFALFTDFYYKAYVKKKPEPDQVNAPAVQAARVDEAAVTAAEADSGASSKVKSA